MTTQKRETLEKISDTGVVAVIRGVNPEKMVDVVEALHEGGVKAMEITSDTPRAMDCINRISNEFKNSDVIVGAGTVLDSETARSAIMSGAEFVVSPNFDPEIAETCNRYGKAVVLGGLTPTEIVNAYEAGADMVKVFPASEMGPEYVSSIKGPLGHVQVMATGGVDLDNAAEFIENGVSVLGIGSSLVDSDAVYQGEFEILRKNAENFIDKVNEARESED